MCRGHVSDDGPSHHLEEFTTAYRRIRPAALRGKPHTAMGGARGTHAEESSPQEARALVGAGSAPL
jgi:hypothetical protein